MADFLVFDDEFFLLPFHVPSNLCFQCLSFFIFSYYNTTFWDLTDKYNLLLRQLDLWIGSKEKALECAVTRHLVGENSCRRCWELRQPRSVAHPRGKYASVSQKARGGGGESSLEPPREKRKRRFGRLVSLYSRVLLENSRTH